MAMGRPKAELVLSDEEQAQLQSIVRSRSLPAALVRRANMVLACAMGTTNSAVARRFGTTNATVGKWRRRFVARRIAGLHDELRPGKPRSIDDARIAALLNTTLHARPKDGATHWSVRGLAAETGLAKTSVHRFLQAFGLQPHRRDSFKLSTDPFFIEKLRDVVGLYLNPPDKALVLCLDEKSQIQALERTQPLLPLGFGYVEGVTHDYLRHGTTTLFAALDLLDGTVLAHCRPRHRHQEFLSFLRAIDQAVPADLAIHVILDNYATHKHPKVKAWLAVRPRWQLHFIPTYSSWLNLVERFFALLRLRPAAPARAKAEMLDGCYLLKTGRTDLDAEEVWRTYILLTRVEAAFRAMKSPLGERPIFHQLERRVDAHIFLCVHAYHLLTAIEKSCSTAATTAHGPPCARASRATRSAPSCCPPPRAPSCASGRPPRRSRSTAR